MAKIGRFEKVVWVALLLELLERLAFYGVYVNLQVYLTGTVHLSDVEAGSLLGVFALVRSFVPVGIGAAADRIGFGRSLAISFALYVLAYLLLFVAPSEIGAWAAVMGMGVAGAFLKPVVPGTVRRHTPPEDRTAGFSYFYASVNLGSVVGKVLTKQVRVLFSLRASMINAVVACVVGLLVAIGLYREPPKEAPPAERATGEAATNEAAPARSTFRDIAMVTKQRELLAFLFIITGYYLLIEQFYQTFPAYITRTLGEGAPREYVTLINPAMIAVFQVAVGRLTKRLPPMFSMAIGVLIGSVSMLLMGALPSLPGMCLSFGVFAFAEMVFSPRYYEYISSFAPPGREALYMGFAIAPLGLGGLAGGFLSGQLIKTYLPANGPRFPLMVWGTYAVIGVFCAAMIGAFGFWTKRRRDSRAANI